MKERGRRFPCSECGRVLTQRSSLRIHVMVRHTGKKPPNIPKLSCLECDKMLKVADSAESTESSADEEESIHEEENNDDKAKRKATLADSEESSNASADKEESDSDECPTTDESENRFETKRSSARLLAAALRQRERV